MADDGMLAHILDHLDDVEDKLDRVLAMTRIQSVLLARIAKKLSMAEIMTEEEVAHLKAQLTHAAQQMEELVDEHQPEPDH